MSLFGFLSDRSLIDPSKRLINLETLALRCGYLDREMIEHFVEPLEIVDHRPSRLTINYRPETFTVADINMYLNDTLLDVVPEGEDHLVPAPGETVTLAQYEELDNFLEEGDGGTLPITPIAIERCLEFKLTFDQAKLTLEEQSALNAAADTEIANLMNVVEYLTYGTISSDSLSDINDALSTSPFSGYVFNSISLLNRSLSFLYSGINIYRLLPKVFTFKFILGVTQFTFTIFVDRKEFRNNYPLTTIIKIIPPVSLPVLLDPSLISDPLDMAINSMSTSNEMMVKEITDNDQSGMVAYTTRHIFNNQLHMVSFNIVYRGKQPSNLLIRQTLADYLINSGVGTRALWEVRLPDIFIINTFFIIPFYDELSVLTNVDIYPSIMNVGRTTTKFNHFIQNFDVDLSSYELMTVAYDKIFLGVASENINEVKSLQQLHPTYRDFSTTDIGFAEMSINDREWSVLFNHILSIASGEINSTIYSNVIIDGYEFTELVRNGNAYHVLTKESYLMNLP